MDVYMRLVSADKVVIYQCQTIITSDLTQKCYETYQNMNDHLQKLFKDLTQHLEVGKCTFTLAIKAAQSTYKVPNEDAFSAVKLKAFQPGSSFSVYCK